MAAIRTSPIMVWLTPEERAILEASAQENARSLSAELRYRAQLHIPERQEVPDGVH